MFWLIYFPVKSHLSLFILRHFSFLIWCLSQSLFFTQAPPISLLSIILLFLTNILLNLALLPHLSFTLKICHFTLRYCSLLLISAIAIFSLEYFSIFFPGILYVSSHTCSFFFSSGSPSHTSASFIFTQVLNFVLNIAGFGRQLILPLTQQRFADGAETMLK